MSNEILDTIRSLEVGKQYSSAPLNLSKHQTHRRLTVKAFSLNIKAETILEGKLDEQASIFKDEYFEEMLDRGNVDADTEEIIENFILPTQFKTSKLDYCYNSRGRDFHYIFHGRHEDCSIFYAGSPRLSREGIRKNR
jgi:hypothetical protein